MDSEARHELNLLEAVEQNGHVTQRGLSTKLGMALGLTNIYLKRLVHKGYIKCVNVQANRLLYLITPAGVAEKTRLTYEYLEHSLRLYRDVRRRLLIVVGAVVREQNVRVAIYGTGEAAELTYVCLKDFGVHPVAVFKNGDGGGGRFFDLPVRSIDDHPSVSFDRLIVATLDDPAELISLLEQKGVARQRLVRLLEPPV